MVLQTRLEIPANILKGVTKGNLIRDGGVIRNADNGQIVTFLHEAPMNPEQNNSTSLPTGDSSIANSLAIGGAIALGGCVLAGLGILIYKAIKNRKDEAEYFIWDEPISKYLRHAKSKEIELEDVIDVLKDFEFYKESNIQISIQTSRFLKLRQLFVTVTKQLYVNNFSFCKLDSGFLSMTRSKKDSPKKIVDDSILTLKYQKELFSRNVSFPDINSLELPRISDADISEISKIKLPD